MSRPSGKKRIIRRYEVILLVGVALVMIYFITKQYGCFLVDTERSEITITDGSSHDKLKRPEKRSEDLILDRDTEETVRELATLFANTKGISPTRTEGGMQRIGLTEDEKAYYKTIRAQYGFDDKIESAQTWFSVLKTAGSTYKSMQSLFQKEQPKEGEKFYRELENQFGIPTAVSREFARRGAEKVSDWALFVEENAKQPTN